MIRNGDMNAATLLEARMLRLATSRLRSLPGHLLILLLATFLTTIPAAADESGFTLDIGGRVQLDWTDPLSIDLDLEDEVGEPEEGTEFRRARLFFKGTLSENVQYKAQLDFAGGKAKIKDMYLAFIKLPNIGTLKVGHFMEPFSLEVQTSSRFITFMERGLPTDFAPKRNMGIMAQNSYFNRRLNTAFGLFREVDDFGESEGAGYAATGRVTGLLLDTENSRKLIHLGAGYSYRDIDVRRVRYQMRPEVHISPRFVDTTWILNTEKVTLSGLEAAMVIGPFSLQGEYIRTDLHRLNLDLAFDSYYVFGSFFLTGEHRPYSHAKGAFGRVKPKNQFTPGMESGWGAWELALRFSKADLSDEYYFGGELENLTVALNWYMNSHTRLMIDWVSSERIGFGEADFISTRFQFDF